MVRKLAVTLTVALLASSTFAQSRIELRQIIGSIPLTKSDRYSDGERAYLYSTRDGHELQVNWKPDSSVAIFVAHPARSVESEADREAFVRQVATNAFGNDSAITVLFKRAATKRDKSSSVQHEVDASGWTLTLMMHNGRISKLLARARNATRR